MTETETQKPEINDQTLEALTILSMLNERYRGFKKTDPEHFHLLAEEAQITYNRQIKPLLVDFAPHYPTIQKEMDTREQIYQTQKVPYKNQ
ncbi:MAG: hypothetical protein U9R08_04170 [Nanoarchaeota archaeon]|nr:hypothetical protein [Nanoarchaeota archaeon]